MLHVLSRGLNLSPPPRPVERTREREGVGHPVPRLASARNAPGSMIGERGSDGMHGLPKHQR
jgi:hypothetical protein